MAAADWSALRCRLVWAYEGDVPAAGNGLQGVSPDLFAWLLLRGSASFSFNRDDRGTLSVGEWGSPPPDARPRIHRFSSDARLVSICFRLEWPDGRRPLGIGRFVSFAAGSQPQLDREAHALARLARGCASRPIGACKPHSLARHAAIQASFMRWLGLWLEAMERHGIAAQPPRTARDARVQRMIEALRAQDRCGPVRYDILSGLSSLRRTQIDRLFKECVGDTPKAIQERHLLELCKERIAASELNVKELAREFGFGGAAQFCAWFKRHVALTPLAFRKSCW